MKISATGFMFAAVSLLMLASLSLAQSGPGTGGGTGTVQSVIVKPGETKTDVVTCHNSTSSTGKCVLKATCAQTYNGFDGSLDNVPPDYVIDLGANNTTTVTGKGGTVNLGSNGTTTVTNTNPPGGASINVKYPGGNTASVGGGGSTTFHS